jgi:uncharacterized membrane protein (UPF0127 family)/CheY-like chemotaxis protein
MEPGSKPIVNLTRGSVVCEQALIADRPLRRMRGLLGRPSLPAGEGLMLQPAPSVHTAFMRFPIDVVFLDRNLQVVKLVERLGPWRTAGARQARSALELAAGEAAARAIQVGDRLGVVAGADHVGFSETHAKSNGKSALIPVGDSQNGRLSGHEPLKVTTRRADPIHVLLVGKDRRFRSVTAALLTRRGCTVTVAERTADASRVAKREAADVVVIDAGSSLAEATREAARVQLVNRTVSVLVVGEHCEERPSAMRLLPKWGSIDELYGAIESACSNANRRSNNDER